MEYIEADYPWLRAYCSRLYPAGFFAFRLCYGEDPETYNEFNRFSWISRRQCTRYRNRYTGPVAVDISDWAEKEPNTCLTDFLYYLTDCFAESNCVLVSEKPCSKALMTHIEKTVRLTKKTLRLQNAGKRRAIGFCTEGTEDVEYV